MNKEKSHVELLAFYLIIIYMLAPGHLAAGYLTAKMILKIIKPESTSNEIENLVLWGTFFGAAPDLDLSYNALHPKKKTVNLGDCSDEQSHRNHFTHAPLFWLAISLLTSAWGWHQNSSFLFFLGIILWSCSWVHFALDSLEDGIRWLWPFNKKFFKIKNIELSTEFYDGNFLSQFYLFLKQYTKKFKITFYLEIVLVIAALIVYFL